MEETYKYDKDHPVAEVILAGKGGESRVIHVSPIIKFESDAVKPSTKVAKRAKKPVKDKIKPVTKEKVNRSKTMKPTPKETAVKSPAPKEIPVATPAPKDTLVKSPVTKETPVESSGNPVEAKPSIWNRVKSWFSKK